MEFFITGLHVALCLFLILVVLLQPGKGADFGAAMGGSTQDVLGAAGGMSLLAKVTTAVASMFMATSLALAWLSNAPEKTSVDVDDIQKELESEAGAATPAEGVPALDGSGAPVPAPAEGEPAPAVPAEGGAAPAVPAEGGAAPAPAGN